ncbi:hypothetical protein [Fodinibius roseus]|uniref:hypothetical protein n=1 Tax=Fodinibius roseus TaxID=1194090 RepID=UPI00147DA8F1|nr:hypothetical protein [Fodinibius roseus]
MENSARRQRTFCIPGLQQDGPGGTRGGDQIFKHPAARESQSRESVFLRKSLRLFSMVFLGE